MCIPSAKIQRRQLKLGNQIRVDGEDVGVGRYRQMKKSTKEASILNKTRRARVWLFCSFVAFLMPPASKLMPNGVTLFLDCQAGGANSKNAVLAYLLSNELNVAGSITPSSDMRSLREWPIWLYVPNLIGYIRIVLSVLAFLNFKKPTTFFAYYFTGFVLDGADGLAARKLNQSSQFGAQLDMLTDRCATAALLTLLAHLYPKAAPLCFLLVFLDGYSHWMQMVAGMCAHTGSHKSATTSKILKLYYWRPCLTVVCSLNEMCFLMLYMKAFSEGPSFATGMSVFDVMLWMAAPVCFAKQMISLWQIRSAHETIRDAL